MIQWIFSEEGLPPIHIENQIGNGGVEALILLLFCYVSFELRHSSMSIEL